MKWLLALLILGSIRCGGGLNVKRAEHYQTFAPPKWEKSEDGESDSAYRLVSGHFVTLTSSCGRDYEQPLSRLTSQLLMGVREIHYAKQGPVKTQEGEGLYSSIQGKFESKMVWLELVVMKSHGCVFDFVATGNQPLPKTESDEFMQFVKTLGHGKD